MFCSLFLVYLYQNNTIEKETKRGNLLFCWRICKVSFVTETFKSKFKRGSIVPMVNCHDQSGFSRYGYLLDLSDKKCDFLGFIDHFTGKDHFRFSTFARSFIHQKYLIPTKSESTHIEVDFKICHI